MFEGLLTLWFCPAPEGWIWFTSLWCPCPDPPRISAHLQNTQSSSTEQRRTKRTEEVQEVLRAQPNIWNPFSTWEVNCLDINFRPIQSYCRTVILPWNSLHFWHLTLNYWFFKIILFWGIFQTPSAYCSGWWSTCCRDYWTPDQSEFCTMYLLCDLISQYRSYSSIIKALVIWGHWLLSDKLRCLGFVICL